QVEYANTLKKKKRVLCASWSDEGISSNSNFDEDQVNNFIAFTSSVLFGSKGDTDNNSNEGSDREILSTYKIMLSKFEQASMESLLIEELENLINTKELAETKLVLENFNVGSSKLDEILSFNNREPRSGGLGD
ncbi:hypothetical protein Golax_008909, partial [Gossypium laxum]|nr:hypothetical protein [Gossypium laxum]